MALSRIVYTGDGVTNQYAIPFSLGYIREADVTCRVGDEVGGLGDPLYRELEFLSPTLVEIQGDVPEDGVTIIFDRTVSRNSLIVDFADGDIMHEENLNTAQKQSIMLVQEVLDGRFETLQNDINMGTFKITNMGEPTADSDAATKNYVDDRIGYIVGFAWNGVDIVDLSTAQTLVNKTLTSPVITDILTSGQLQIRPSTAINMGFELGQQIGGVQTNTYLDLHCGSTVVDYDVRISAQGGTGVIGGAALNISAGAFNLNGKAIQTIDNTAVLFNKSLDQGTTYFVGADTTKRLRIDISAYPTATTRTATVPNANGVFMFEDNTAVMSNKTTDASCRAVANPSPVSGTLLGAPAQDSWVAQYFKRVGSVDLESLTNFPLGTILIAHIVIGGGGTGDRGDTLVAKRSNANTVQYNTGPSAEGAVLTGTWVHRGRGVVPWPEAHIILIERVA